MRKVKLDKIEIPDHVTYRCIHCGHIRGEKFYACTDKEGHEFYVKPENERRKYRWKNSFINRNASAIWLRSGWR